VIFDGVEEGAVFEWEWRRVEDRDADADEDGKQRELEGVDDVVAKLRCNEVQPENRCHGEGKKSGRTKQRIDADDDADGDGPGELTRSDADAEKVEERIDNMTAK